MSYEDLDLIRAAGIDAIVNLCGEFCDLHEIEENSGFEVYYLPVPDESAPDMADIQEALAWLDEAIYLGNTINRLLGSNVRKGVIQRFFLLGKPDDFMACRF